MTCLPTPTQGELEFVQALLARDITVGECRGPLLRLAFWPFRLYQLEHIMDSEPASDVLWDGFLEDGCVGVHFELCGAHWIDLAALCELRALQYHRVDWSRAGDQLMQDVCNAAGWDSKEFLNMVAWQREKLT